MTKYNRITGKVFGGNANATGDNPEIGQFGSAKDGSYIGTSDISSIQALPAWGKGWVGAVTPETNFPPLPEMTGAMKVFSEQQCYLLQQGIPEWDNATIYYKNGFSSKNGKIYISQSDENQGNDPEADTVNWKEFSQDKANKDLDNLTEAGEKHFLNKSQITNCLLEVPQRIKLELNDGTITLKAGSKVYALDGSSYTIPTDVTSSYSHKTAHSSWILVKEDGNIFDIWTTESASNISIGSKWVTFNGVNCYLPICLATHNADGTTKSGWKSIDQVFNGFGYIGSTVWVDKGVKGLIPNGRNEDGTLNNIEFTTDKVLTYTNKNNFADTWVFQFSSANTGIVAYPNYIESDSEPTNIQGWTVWFNTRDNINYIKNIGAVGASWKRQDLCNNQVKFTTNSSGIITSFQPKLPFRAVNYNDFEESLATKADVTTPSIQAPYIKENYVNGTSWYRVWSDGWCEQGGYTEFRYNTPVTLLRNYTNTNWSIQTTPSTDTGEAVSIQIISKTTWNFTPRPQRGTGNGANQTGYWYACGY